MKVTSVKGTDDFLPKEAELRDYIMGVVLDTYKSFGFSRIYTPIVEDIENLEKSDGGDNLNLIFKVLKRGDKLKSAIDSNDFDNLCDIGLRYDLTLPLSRFYSCHKQDLPQTFKCIQVDQVFRAERPQKGRSREFVQCDIDILGSDKIESEIELIDVTANALLNLGLKNFKVKINDRKILKNILIKLGFDEGSIESVCVSFDKLDKIGIDGVCQELQEKQFSANAIEKFRNFLNGNEKTLDDLFNIAGDMREYENIKTILSSVKQLANGKYDICFDISLVRGQGYYTGTIFEIESEDYSCSIAGGGRYDNLIGKFDGQKVPAVGFSIGFERIFSILKDKNFVINKSKKKLAVIYSENDFVDAFSYAKKLQKDFDVSVVPYQNKMGKLLSKLENQDFDCYVMFDDKKDIKNLIKNG